LLADRPVTEPETTAWTSEDYVLFMSAAEGSMTSRLDPSLGIVSTFPPTVCGIASYTASLVQSLTGRKNAAHRIGVVRLTDGLTPDTGSPVAFNHRPGDPTSLRTAAAILNTYDAVSLQHEFGIYGGRDGVEVLDLMPRLEVPMVVTLHTVLSEPTAHQRWILENICTLAERIVVMSETASRRLVECYGVDERQISVIAHGADPAFAGPSLVTGNRPLILTWGLIGPGKGLEWAIEAFAHLTDLEPLPRYLIAGATHPHVLRESGESYRQSLKDLTMSLGLGEIIEFDDRYMSRTALARLVRSTDVVVLPYESAEQVTSGVLVEAIAASKPVVATPFPHAIELLADGAGGIFPFGDPGRLAEELRHIVSNHETRSLMSRRARELAADWYWPAIGERFAEMVSSVVANDTTYATPSSGRQLVAG
jgi:glycosyltransferase involved in cell wall biosynthesis